MAADTTTARELTAFIDASPTPYHACAEAARLLAAAGFRRLEELDAWRFEKGGFFVVRGGSLVAWRLFDDVPPARGFRILGAHTDSPNLRVKPRPDTGRAGYRQLGVEVYGSALLNSWLDRDLGLAGRAFVRSAGKPVERLFRVDRPVLRIPQLAIHLDRDVNTDGLKLNRQAHMVPVFGLASSAGARGFRGWLASELDVLPDEILAWDAMLFDLMPSTLAGLDEEFVSAPRLDNQCSCFTGLKALLTVAPGPATPHVPVLSLFDHEEVGSGSRSGAEGSVLADLLERAVLARGGTREDYHRAIADSFCVSADMAHATHPNYVEKHEPDHHVHMNAGPVIKINTNLRYASEGETEALFQTACEAADVPFQKWVNRTDLACGSTIGPITAKVLGVRTVDVGCPELAMHSVRELCGSRDPGYLTRALVEVLRG